MFPFNCYSGLQKNICKNGWIFRKNISLFAIPLLVTLLLVTLFYPGFMSYDSLHALHSARSGVTDSMWPPMVSYVWRAVDQVSHNPSAMHFTQLFLLNSSIFFLLLFFTQRIKYAMVFFIVYLSIPAVLGTVAVIWKDVLMASFLLAGFATTIAAKKSSQKRSFSAWIFVAIILLFLGTCSRHNAITGAVPLLFFLAMVICARFFSGGMRLWFGSFLLGVVLIAGIFTAKIFIDNYALPNLTRLPGSSGSFIQTVRALDIAGASLCVGSNLFSDMAPDLSTDDIKRDYDPRHINLSQKLLSRLNYQGGIGIDKIWLDVAIHHPVCFLHNKLQLTKFMVGADSGRQFLITAPSIDSNEYGYHLENSRLRDVIVSYIVNSSEFFFFKPWFIYVLSFVSFIYLLRVNGLTAPHLALFSSGLFYFGGLVAFGNAADARLLFYTTTVFSMLIFISVIKFKTRFK